MFDAKTGGVIHQERPPPGSVRISPKPEAVTVTPLIVVEDPKPGKALTVGHIGQTGVGVGNNPEVCVGVCVGGSPGVTVIVGVTVGVGVGQGSSNKHTEQSPNCSIKVAKSSVYDIRVDAGVDDETLVIHPLNDNEDK